MKEFAKQFENFVRQYGFDIARVFDDFLEYIIWLHTMPEYGHPIENWKYTKEQSKELFEIYRTLLGELHNAMAPMGWYDAFGELYETLIISKYRQGTKGQFFTPQCLCELMTDLVGTEKQSGKLISDPACGSGRTLLAFNAHNLGNCYVAEDIDRTCCLMTAVNFLLHGMRGEVIWHNTLVPDSFRQAWRTNEQLGQFCAKYYSIPHIREVKQEETMLHRINQERKKCIRITDKLTATLKRHEAALSKLKAGELSSDERKRQETTLTKKINNIKLLLDEYRKK